VAEPLRPHAAVAPRPRLSLDGRREGYFYPREVAEILGCPEIDYYQLRRLFELARAQSGRPPAVGWGRYTLTDIAAVRVALDLAGGKPALAAGRRLQIAPVARACEALVAMGVREPLLEVPMFRQGRNVFAVVGGGLIDPVTGQIVLREVFQAAKNLLDRTDGALVDQLRQERDRRMSQARLRIQAQHVVRAPRQAIDVTSSA
jgi:hypothetical protein